jgi:hypothetical protein
MSKDKTLKAANIQPISNGWILVSQEAIDPNPQPRIEQAYYSTAAEACAAAAEFLEPQVLQIVTGGN